jgi:hypothetical protein
MNASHIHSNHLDHGGRHEWPPLSVLISRGVPAIALGLGLIVLGGWGAGRILYGGKLSLLKAAQTTGLTPTLANRTFVEEALRASEPDWSTILLVKAMMALFVASGFTLIATAIPSIRGSPRSLVYLWVFVADMVLALIWPGVESSSVRYSLQAGGGSVFLLLAWYLGRVKGLRWPDDGREGRTHA